MKRNGGTGLRAAAYAEPTALCSLRAPPHVQGATGSPHWQKGQGRYRYTWAWMHRVRQLIGIHLVGSLAAFTVLTRHAPPCSRWGRKPQSSEGIHAPCSKHANTGDPLTTVTTRPSPSWSGSCRPTCVLSGGRLHSTAVPAYPFLSSEQDQVTCHPCKPHAPQHISNSRAADLLLVMRAAAVRCGCWCVGSAKQPKELCEAAVLKAKVQD